MVKGAEARVRLAPAQVRARPIVAQTWLWRAQTLVSNYLPLLVMAMLASGTWWLMKSTPSPDEAGVLLPPRHEPDYQMANFNLTRMDAEGLLRVAIDGRALRHYPDTDTLEIDGISLRSYGSDGGLTLATANRAISNGDGSELQLLGAVHVRRFNPEPGESPQGKPNLEVRGEFLHAFVNTEILRSHLPVQLNYAGTELKAQSFEFDYLSSRLRFEGRTQARVDAGATNPASKKKASP